VTDVQHEVTPRRALAAAGALTVVGLLAWGAGLSLLVRRWLGAHPAVFEADQFAQRVSHAVSTGSLWPWDLGADWYFLLMAPGIYLHFPVLALFPGGLAPLLLQAAAVAVTAPLLALLARRCGASVPAAAGLGLIWLFHPISGGIAMAWGWSPYATAAPLFVGALLAAGRGRRTTALALFALAAAMKVNAAVMLLGIGAWMILDGRTSGEGRGDPAERTIGWTLVVGAAAWALLAGGLFASAALCAGNLLRDVHLDASGSGPTVGGMATVALMLLPALPLLDRRGWLLVTLALGVEMAYTVAINPANSGLVPATAVLLAAGASRVPSLRWPERRIALAAVLALLCHALFRPPGLVPLPLQPAAMAYAPGPAGSTMRAWVDALPDDLGLVADRRTRGVTGTHRGFVIEPEAWSGSGTVAVLLAGPVPERFVDCVDVLIPRTQAGEPVLAGICGSGSPAPDPTDSLGLTCLAPQEPGGP
jgi:hypothetical protein